MAADHNELQTFSTPDITMAKLRILRLSDNLLTRIDLAGFPNLRTLYMDNNKLGDVLNAGRLTKLENLSLRSQVGRGLYVTSFSFLLFGLMFGLGDRTINLFGPADWWECRDRHSLMRTPFFFFTSFCSRWMHSSITGLYQLVTLGTSSVFTCPVSSPWQFDQTLCLFSIFGTTGNPLNDRDLFPEPLYNLVYLEMAACRLSVLPANMAQMVPNLRVLNVNYNFLSDVVKPLTGLTRLRKLTVVGSRMKASKPLVRMLQKMPEVELLDFR